MVAAARAPLDLLVGLEVFPGERGGSGHQSSHEGLPPSTFVDLLDDLELTRNGRPCTLLQAERVDEVVGRASNIRNCPRFSSQTSTLFVTFLSISPDVGLGMGLQPAQVDVRDGRVPGVAMSVCSIAVRTAPKVPPQETTSRLAFCRSPKIFLIGHVAGRRRRPSAPQFDHASGGSPARSRRRQ